MINIFCGKENLNLSLLQYIFRTLVQLFYIVLSLTNWSISRLGWIWRFAWTNRD